MTNVKGKKEEEGRKGERRKERREEEGREGGREGEREGGSKVQKIRSIRAGSDCYEKQVTTTTTTTTQM
jgi:hypothetical protein